jgi:two-component system, sensor histidine kinase PdtaS
MPVYRFLFLIIFVVSTCNLFGQSEKLVDSLKVQLEKSSGNEKEKIRLLLNLAFYSNPTDGLNFAQNALSLASQSGNFEYEALAWEIIGTKNRLMGNNLLATDAQIKASKIYHKHNMKEKEATIYLLLGANFGNDNDFTNSLKYLNSALGITIETKDTFRTIIAYTNLGETYRKMGEYETALHYFNLGIQNFSDDIPEDTKAILTGNKGLVYSAQNKIDSAKLYLNKAIGFFEESNDVYMLTFYKGELGLIQARKGNRHEGEKILLECYNMAYRANLKEQIRDVSLYLSEFYEKEGRFGESLTYHKKFKSYNDSLKNIENVRALEQLQSNFELGKKEEEISNLNRIYKLQRNFTFSLAIAIGAVLLFLIFLYRVNRIIKQNNIELTEQKKLIEKREQEKALLLKELNHRVKNNLQMVSSLLSLQARQLKGHPSSEVLLSGKYRVEALTLIHQKLYRDDVDTNIDIKGYIDELTRNLVLNFGEEFNLSLNLSSFVMNIDKAIPFGLIVNEIVTNSLKYGKPTDFRPQLWITLAESPLGIILSIRDNGNGLPEGFEWEKSKSFGLKLVHSLVSQLGGKLNYSNENGSRWEFEFDKSKLV